MLGFVSSVAELGIEGVVAHAHVQVPEPLRSGYATSGSRVHASLLCGAGDEAQRREDVALERRVRVVVDQHRGERHSRHGDARVVVHTLVPLALKVAPQNRAALHRRRDGDRRGSRHAFVGARYERSEGLRLQDHVHPFRTRHSRSADGEESRVPVPWVWDGGP